MKTKITSILLCFIIIRLTAFNQTIYKNYIDGEVYIKVKKGMPFKFNSLTSNVEILTELPFLIPLMNKYSILKAKTTFYFSKSDTLKRILRLYFKASERVDNVIKDLQSLPEIEYAEKIPLIRLDYTPNDFGDNSYNGQYALYKINAQNAWNVSRGDKSVLIAIVDNAEDINHQDLFSNVVKSRDVSDNDNNPEPPKNDHAWEHGTHTSGIACAGTNNSTGISSIGFNCGLMAVKASPDITPNDSGNYVYDGYEGITWAVQNGAKVISCSWGSTEFSSINQSVITDAYNNNVLVVASAGNNNNSILNYPAAYDHVLSVAATDINDAKANFSSYGTWVDVSAPGVSILSTFPGEGSYGYLSGTSMSAPLVAGLCGLVRSVNLALSVDQVINVIKNSCDNINSQNPGYNGLLGSGRINAYQAVENALPCNTDISLGSGSYSVPKTESSGSITSANSIPINSAVIFDAATIVRLLPGFHASNGSGFDAYIDGCGGNKFFSSVLSSKNTNVKISNALERNMIKSVYNNNLISYPNPTSSIIHLGFSTEKYESNASVEVYNAAMQKVKEIRLRDLIKGRQNKTIDLSGQSAGLYYIIVMLQNKNLTATVSVIK